VSRKKQRWIRCNAFTTDGSQCGRSAPADTKFCHLHIAQQSGTPVGGATQFTKAKRTPRERIERIANDDKHPRQLEAIRMLRDEENCSGCAARAEQTRADEDFYARLTDAQRLTLGELVLALNDLKAVAATQPRRDPDAIPAATLERWTEDEPLAEPVVAPMSEDTAGEPDDAEEEAGLIEEVEIIEKDGSSSFIHIIEEDIHD
jgi:hypothetical protein